jgi:hypothetical protein
MFPPSSSAATAAPKIVPSLHLFSSPAALPAEQTDVWDSPIAATAMAVSALVLSEQHGGELGEIGESAGIDSAYQGDLSELLVGSMHWLAKRQRIDGGWGSQCEASSRLDTTLLVRAAFQLTGVPVAYPDLAERMNAYIESHGGAEALKPQRGPASNASLMVRGCLALAEVVDLKHLPTVPIETASFSDISSSSEFWSARGSSLPAVVALGLASCQLHPPRNPLTRWRRTGATHQALDWLAHQQSDDGGFSNSIPVTSLVIMSLASIGKTSTRLVRRGVEFLFSSVDGDGSWPGESPSATDAIDTQAAWH